MADLGSITAYPMDVRNQPTSCVSGQVREEGVPVGRRTVRMHLRDTGALINQVFSQTNGTFSMATLRTLEGAETYVIALDDDSGTAFNALIYDRITPV